MRRSRIRDGGEQVSLFPFLAVLICTMGVLVVLLVLVVKQADLSKASARDERRQQLDDETKRIDEQIAEADFLAGMLDEHRPTLNDSIRDQSLRRGHYREQQLRLEEQLRTLSAQAAALASSEPTATDDAAETLRQQIAAAEAALETARAERAGRGAQYALVAYDGRNGTRRRPIYIECTPTGIDLQPFGIRLTPSDFPRPILAGNPLDSAILAIRDTWLRQDPTGADGAPYPLIIVRPGGSEAYAIVREALKSWDSEFGHQIVPESVAIAYPPPPPGMSDELERIIADAKLRQQRMIASMAIAGGSGRGGVAARPAGFGGGNSGSGDGSFGDGSASGGSGSNGSNRDFVLRATGRHGGFVDSGGGSGGGGAFRGSGSSSRSGTGASAAADGAADSSGTDVSKGASETRNAGSNGEGSESVEGMAGGPGGPAGAGSANGTAGGRFGGSGGSGGPAGTGTGTGTGEAALADQRGAGWALPSRSPNAVAYRRPLRLSCRGDRLLLLSEDRPGAVVREFPFRPDVASAIDPMVDHLWSEIDSWGVAGYGAYWKPELRVDVAPEAAGRFADLKRLLENSGLDVVEVRP